MPSRRAMLAVALTFGLIALMAALVTEPREDSGGETAAPPPAREQAGGGTERVVFDAARPRTHEVEAGTRAEIEVKVPGPGQVALEGLGLLAPADSRTPATFDVLVGRPGRHAVVFKPVEAADRRAGALVVVRAR